MLVTIGVINWILLLLEQREICYETYLNQVIQTFQSQHTHLLELQNQQIRP